MRFLPNNTKDNLPASYLMSLYVPYRLLCVRDIPDELSLSGVDG